MHALSLLLLQMLYLSLSWWLQYYTINYTGSDIVVWLLFTEFTCMWVLVCTEPSFPGRISKFEPLHQSSISDGKKHVIHQILSVHEVTPKVQAVVQQSTETSVDQVTSPSSRSSAELKETSRNHAPTVWIDLRHFWCFMSCTKTYGSLRFS